MGPVRDGNPKPICPLHTCNECKVQILFAFSSKKNNMWRCFRCPLAYDFKHRPRDVHIISEGIFLCIRHIQEDEDLPQLSNDIFKKLEMNHRMYSDGESITPPAIRARLQNQRKKLLENSSRLREHLRNGGDRADDGVIINKKRLPVGIGHEEDEGNSDDDHRNNPRGNKAIKKIRLRNDAASSLYRYYLELITFLLVLIRIVSSRHNRNGQNHFNDWHQNYNQNNLYPPQV